MVRRYSDEDRANALAALAANGDNLDKTSKQLDIPFTTLRNWAKGLAHPEAARLGDEKKAPLADRLEEVAHQLLDGLPKKIDKATLQQIAVALGITVEKMRLLREQPTQLASEALSDEERLSRLQALYDRVRSRRGGAAPPAGNGTPANPG